MTHSSDGTEPERGWRQYMPVDVAERRAKASKILRALRRIRELEGAHVLEIGTGTGVIPACLAEAVGRSGLVQSIDTMDTRVVNDGYDFRLVSGVDLPFPDEFFDVVVSNHVTEHVGDRDTQQRHLEEIRRVLRPTGVAYLATPSRWALVEPHFRVPLLSWPPRAVRSMALRATRRGQVYDVDPYGPSEIRRAFERAGLAYQEAIVPALRDLAATDDSARIAKVLARLPERLLELLSRSSPTMVFLLTRRA